MFVKKQKQTRERPTRGRGATSSYNKNNKIPGPSYIYDSEGPVALSLGLIILRDQCVSGHVVRASFVSDTPPKCLDREGLWRRRTGAGHGTVWTSYKEPLIST